MEDKSGEVDMNLIQPGDIVGIREPGVSDWGLKIMNFFMAPKNDLLHYALVSHFDERLNDWVLIESISKGVTFQLLKNWYLKRKSTVAVFRVADATLSQRMKAISNIYCYANKKFDYKLIVKLIGWYIGHFFNQLFHFKNPIHKFKASDFPYYKSDENFFCTELVVRAYADDGIYIVPKDVLPLPSSLKQAENDGRLKLIYTFNEKIT